MKKCYECGKKVFKNYICNDCNKRFCSDCISDFHDDEDCIFIKKVK